MTKLNAYSNPEHLKNIYKFCSTLKHFITTGNDDKFKLSV